MLDIEESVSGCVGWLTSNVMLTGRNRTPAPTSGELSVIVEVDHGHARARCVWRGAPKPDFEEYAFYLMSGKKRLQTRWYEASPEAQFDLSEQSTATHVVGFIRDGVGNKMHALAMLPRPLRVFVLGSCVSRDAFEISTGAVSLVRYVARSSLATAFSGRAAPPHLHRVIAELDSNWQRKMVQVDLEKKLPRLLTEEPFDLLLLDLVDERFAISMFDDVALTISSEFAKGFGSLDGLELLNSLDQRRMKLWLQGVKALVRLVGADRIVLNRVKWATHDSDGNELADQARIAINNGRLDVLYRRLEQEFRVRSIEYPDGLLTADNSHKWGVAPYHYIPEMYLHTIRALETLALPAQVGPEAKSLS